MAVLNMPTWVEWTVFSRIHLPLCLLLEWVTREILRQEVKTQPLCSAPTLLIGWITSMVWDIGQPCNCSFPLDPLCFSDSSVWHVYLDIWWRVFLHDIHAINYGALRTNSVCHHVLQVVHMQYSLFFFASILNSFSFWPPETWSSSFSTRCKEDKLMEITYSVPMAVWGQMSAIMSWLWKVPALKTHKVLVSKQAPTTFSSSMPNFS